LRFI